MGFAGTAINSAKKAYTAIHGLATTKPKPAPAPQAPTAPPAATPPPQEPAPRYNAKQVAQIEDQFGALPARRIGGRGAKPGATYRSGQYKGMTAGQAWTKIAGDVERGGGNSAIDAHKARQGRSLASDLGLVGDGQRVPSSAAMSPTTRASAVGEFRNSPAVVDANAKPTAGDRNRLVSTARGAFQGAQARLFGSTPGQSPVQATPGASPAAPTDPVADFKSNLTALAAPPAGPTAPATPAAPAATAKAPAAGASPAKKRPA